MTGAGPEVLDTLGMWNAQATLADQMADAVAAAATVDLPPSEGITSVVVFGMGGSGIGGDVLAAYAGSRTGVPIVVSKHYECPRFVGPDTLAIAVSFSGNTEETLSAASQAAAAGARLICVTTGGRLQALAGEVGAHLVPVDPSIVMPRAALGATSLPLLVILSRLGLLDDPATDIAAAVSRVRARTQESLGPTSTARSVARRVGRTQPVIYGGGPLGQVAAARWKAQCNENCKIPAYANVVPELCHNELCAWGQHGDVTRQVNTLVFLRHPFEHPQIARRFSFIDDRCAETVSEVITVEAEGAGELEALFDLMVIGDYVTLYLAAQEEIDPGPVPVLFDLKGFLAD